MPSRKILLVEDDVDIRENMAMVLAYEGHKVLEAEHGIDALKRLEENQLALPDVILLDLFMPVMNGREFLDAVQTGNNESFKKLPVILITAAEQASREDLDKRVAAVIRKPIDLKPFFYLLETITE